MIKNRNLFLIIGFFIIFIFGFSLGSPELPFNDSLKLLYQNTFQIHKDKNFETIEPIFQKTNVRSIIDIDSKNDILEKRNNLINFIWKSEKIPTDSKIILKSDFSDERFSSLENLQQINRYEIEMEYGINSVAYLFLPNVRNDVLVIYHQGHAGDFIEGFDTIDSLLRKNYAVLAFSMPLLGQNNQPEIDIPHLGVIQLENHNNLQFLDSENFSSIKFFVHPIFVSLNHIDHEFDFKQYNMIGISGGAWTTTLYSAIDHRIEKSYAIGGPLPLFLTINVPGNHGDYELNHKPLYDNANMLELFIMSGYGDERKHTKFLNQYDPCCYYGISYQLFENELYEIMNMLNNGKLEIILDSTTRQHIISKPTINSIINSMNID
tara:strand:+ start:2863 stop:3996 length:1134 start_codon:yes stop_codon:yes gene_type:complete